MLVLATEILYRAIVSEALLKGEHVPRIPPSKSATGLGSSLPVFPASSRRDQSTIISELRSWACRESAKNLVKSNGVSWGFYAVAT